MSLSAFIKHSSFVDLVIERSIQRGDQKAFIFLGNESEKKHSSQRPNYSVASTVKIDGQERLVVIAKLERCYLKQGQVSASNNEREPEPKQGLDRRQFDSLLISVSDIYQHPDFSDFNQVTLDSQGIAKKPEIQIYTVLLIQTGSIPKISSGKIQRIACYNAFLAGTFKKVLAEVC